MWLFEVEREIFTDEDRDWCNFMRMREIQGVSRSNIAEGKFEVDCSSTEMMLVVESGNEVVMGSSEFGWKVVIR